MALVKQLVPDTIAYLLIRLGKDGKGEGEMEKGRERGRNM